MRPQHHRQEKQVGYVILEVPKGLGSTQGTRRLGVSSGCTVNTDGFSLHGSRKSVALVTAADTAARPPAAPDSFSTGSRKNPVAGGRAGPGPKLGGKNKKNKVWRRRLGWALTPWDAEHAVCLSCGPRALPFPAAAVGILPAPVPAGSRRFACVRVLFALLGWTCLYLLSKPGDARCQESWLSGFLHGTALPPED